MSQSIIKHLQDYLGAHIEKINPNTQAIDPATRHHRYDLLAQAAIPAVLTAFYKHSRSPSGAKDLAGDIGKSEPLDFLLKGRKAAVVTKIAAYSGVSEEQSEAAMDAVADESIRFVRNKLGSNMNAENIQTYFASQRQDILSHLPEDIRMGELLDDNTLDDRTNKMAGPISSVAQAISNLLSSPGTEDNDRR
ncbi:hypothetical protein [Flavihumibacter petaseus]|uniref:Uncharacterized protein n=1 Tax=Flavihumibacter petaseus NBRC 106054 TaxID=1220578 RepID=A0A0E9MXK5_9BACT|nr:hypothetical protein [Flavihumibacter petaseus]GAO42432.1 hypothetical protein FPE01S_01_14470 [Flavihumibacter petaseus NBRC 106054]